MRLQNAQLRVNSFAIEARAANSSAEMRIKRVGDKL